MFFGWKVVGFVIAVSCFEQRVLRTTCAAPRAWLAREVDRRCDHGPFLVSAGLLVQLATPAANAMPRMRVVVGTPKRRCRSSLPANRRWTLSLGRARRV